MSYTTLESLLNSYKERELIRLSNIDNNAIVVDESVIEDLILQTDSEIDSYLRVRYSLPLLSTYDVLESIANKLVYYKLKLKADSIQDKDKEIYKNSIDYLTKLANGKVLLESQARPINIIEHSISNQVSPGRVFNDTFLGDF